MPNDVKVGFLGLGAMGLGMASHMAKNGFDVTGYDINQEAMSSLVTQGGQAASSPRQAAINRSIIVVVVATSDQASDALLNTYTGAAETLDEGAIIILCITASPEYAPELKEQLSSSQRSDLRLIDCPISGGEVRAWQGDLSLICSGNQDDISKANKVLDAMSSQIHLIPGGIGRASSVKMVHQILVGVHILAAVEVMGLCAVAGLDPLSVYNSVESSESRSWLFSQRAAHIIDKNQVPASSLMIITKDFALLNQSARTKSFPLPLSSMAYQIFLQATAAGHTADDCQTLDLYLSGRQKLESFPKTALESTKENNITAETIKHILSGIHSAVSVEALAYAQRLGVPASAMRTVVASAAGSSPLFDKIASTFQDNGSIPLRDISDFEEIARRLSAGVQTAAEINYPTFLANSALQQFYAPSIN